VTLTLHYHPLASYCWKVLIALYEQGTPFTPNIVDLSDPAQRAALARLYPFAQFPVLRDDGRDQTVPESTIIIEYLAQHYPGPTPLIPADRDLARETRLADRLYDLRVQTPMQKIVGDRLRPDGAHDPHGVADARAQLAIAYGIIEGRAAERTWAVGDAFTLADCAAAPALYYADRVQPLGADHPQAAAYLARLRARPSVARVLDEAGPYFAMFPG
jgi:glutathione S-transferase